MKKIIIGLSLLLFMMACSNKKPIDISKGVSFQLASFRKSQIKDLKYKLSFNIPLELKDSVKSKEIINLNVLDTSHPLVLDFFSNRSIPTQATVNGKSIKLIYKNQHLIIPKENLIKGQNQIEINFWAGELSLNRNKNYLFTLLVPDRARTLFPCFDQPDLKANYLLNLSVPKDWKVEASAPLAKKTEQGDFADFQFKESDLMSTYLFSFVAGKFSEAHSTIPGFKSTMLYQEKDPEKIKSSVPEIFKLHQHAVKYLEAYTNYPYPFQKLDCAAIYTHPYGGMEHVGAIQYRQSHVFLDPDATISEQLERAKVISHETSHQWFGDLVTMKWFNEVWLKEVFANFMADKISDPQFPNVNHNLSFFIEHYPSAYSIDRTIGANPIEQDLDNLNMAGSLYGRIIYDKAPIMMRQLETLIGKDKFKEAVQQYIHKYANSNADWDDLVNILDTKTPIDLKQWSKVWVYSPGRPIIKSKINYTADNHIASFTLNQQAEDGSTNFWSQVFDITLVYSDHTKNIQVDFEQQDYQIKEAVGLQKPIAIIYNSNGLGYGVFPTSKAELNSAPAIDTEVTRAQIYLNCQENVLLGNIAVKDAIKLYEKAISNEPNELILNMLCQQFYQLYWYYISDKTRAELEPTITDILYKRLQSKDKTNIKKTLLKLYYSVGYTGVAREKLYDLWSKKLSIPNLNLNSDDYTKLAFQLALFNHPLSAKIMSEQRARLSDPNELLRFDFITPAVSNDPITRSKFFNSFKKETNREKESWVAVACSYLHHPLHQKTAINDLKLSLDLLEEIQKTGDIFFPKSWLDNTVGKYASHKAYKIVKQFLENHPNLNSKLKMKVLQSTDPLYRLYDKKCVRKW